MVRAGAGSLDTILEALASPAAGPAPGLSTGEWLGRWLASRTLLRASTARSYAAHVRGYLVPYLGGIPLATLIVGDVQAMFTAVIRDESPLGPVSAATLHRIHATLRAALNGAVRAGLIAVNPGRYPELPREMRPRPQVWNSVMTERWQRQGRRPTRPLQRRPDRRCIPERRRRTRPEIGSRCRATGPEGGQEPAGRRQRPKTQRTRTGRDHRLTIRHPGNAPVRARGPTLPERPEDPAQSGFGWAT